MGRIGGFQLGPGTVSIRQEDPVARIGGGRRSLDDVGLGEGEAQKGEKERKLEEEAGIVVEVESH